MMVTVGKLKSAWVHCMLENEPLMEAVVELTATTPLFAYQITPAGWLGAFCTIIEQDDWVGAADTGKVKVPNAGGVRKFKVTSICPFTPFSVTLPVVAQLGLVQPGPETFRKLDCVAGLELLFDVPVTVGAFGLGLPPVPVSSLKPGLMPVLLFFSQENRTTEIKSTVNGRIRSFFIIIFRN